MPEKTGRFAIIEQLLADGCQYMFGNPGTVEQGFLDALQNYPELTYISTLQESVAVAIADGYARAVRRPAVVQLHSGVGLGNGIGMLYQAKRGHAPLMVLAGEAGIRYDAMDAQMAADLVAMARPVTKWAARVVDASSVLRMLRRALKMAATPPSGPVFLCLPMDVLDAPNTEEVVPISLPVTRVRPEPEQIAAAAALLAAAAQPLFIVGDGVAFSEAQPELARVAELVGAAVWGADSSEVNLSAAHPLFQGLLGHMFGEHSRAIIALADVVLICGTYVFPEVFPTLSSAFASGTRVIHIDLDDYEIAKNFPVDLGLVSDPKATLAQLAQALDSTMTVSQKEAARTRAAKIAAQKEQELAEQLAADRAGDQETPLRPARFMEELAAQVPRDAVIFDEALTVSPELTRYLPPTQPGHYFQTRGGSLGVGIPGAIGAKLAHPGKTVIGFTGDGGSMYTIQALWTAARYRVGAKFVICNNHAYQLLKLNILQYWRERSLPEHAFPSAFDLTPPEIDFVGLARALGVRAVRVENPGQIQPAISQALGDNEPFLIDLVVADAVPGQKIGCKCGQ